MPRATGRLVAGATALLACVEPPPGPAPARDAADFLDRLHELDELPRLEDASLELSSTWDRGGGHILDGQGYEGIDGDINVLLDVDGPGCIHRISTGVLEFNGDILDASFELWLDGERTLALPAHELFDPEASPFAGPLVHDGLYPTVRMPIPFAEHATIRLISPIQEWGLFWQIAYSRYPAQTRVETLELPFDERTQHAFDRAGVIWSGSLIGPPEPDADPIVIAQSLAPGAAMSWEDRGCGTIERLELSADPNWPAAWRALQIRVTWDDAERPAIEAPVHRFLLGTEYGDDPLAVFDSLVIGAEDGRAYVRLPMPYREAAKIELHNAAQFEVDVELAVWRERCEAQPDDFGYLHTTLEQAPAATPESPRAGPLDVPVHRAFEQHGRGKLVGTGLRLYWPYRNLWWGEGDWQIWTDRDFELWPPSYHGTGTEEFFDGGWTHFERRPLAGAVKGRPGVVTTYAFLLDDAFNFAERMRMQVETVGLFEAEAVIAEEHPEWATTVYWYGEQPG